MSATIRELHFAITVADSSHWDRDHIDAAENDAIARGSYDDWAIARLDEAMRKAGNQFIRENDDLFMTSELA